MRAVAGSVDITPALPAAVGGNRPDLWFSNAAEPLEANVCVVFSDKGQLLFSLVAIDTLYAGTPLRKRLLQAVPELGNAPLWLCASHTHRAPMIDETKPMLGSFDAPYLHLVASRVGDLLRTLIGSASSARRVTWRVGTGTAQHSINRRLVTRWPPTRSWPKRRVRLAPYPRGVTDERVTTLLCVSDAGETLAVVWNYACHPVGAPAELGLSAHFPAPVRDHLRSALGESELPVLFLQGFSGNTRPLPTAKRWFLGSRRPYLRAWPYFADLTKAEYEAWAGSLATVVESVCNASAAVMNPKVTSSDRQIPLEQVVSNSQRVPARHLAVRSIRLGDEVVLLGVSAEMMSEHAAWARQQTSARAVLPVGCLDDTFGYLPTRGMLEDGGYEATGFCPLFDIEGVRASADSLTRTAITEVLGRHTA